MSRVIIFMLLFAGAMGFTAVIVGIAITVEYDWPRRLLGPLVCALGIAVIFIAVIGISGELGVGEEG